MSGLGAEKARGADQVLELRALGGGHVLGRRVAGEQGWHDEVDALVGALGGKDCRDEQLERVVMDEGAQLAGGARILISQTVGDLAGPGEGPPASSVRGAELGTSGS